MKYLKFTYVDAQTGVPITQAPAANGPVFPHVHGLEYRWARESLYPTATPEFFGVCPQDSDTDIPGVLAVMTEYDYGLAYDDEMLARDPVPVEVARYAGLLALERHRLVAGELIEVADDLPEPADSLLSHVYAYYDTMDDGLDKSKMHKALSDVLHWLRASPAVENIRLLLGLTHAQVDALFRWAKRLEATI